MTPTKRITSKQVPSPEPPESLPRSRRTLSGIAEQAEGALRKASRRVLIGIAVAVLLALVLSAASFVVSVSTAAQRYSQAVTGRAQAGREQLAMANTSRVLRGLPAFPDPGPDASPDLIWLSAARAWQGVDAVDIAQGRAPGQPGVTTPGVPGSFPQPTR